MKFNKWTLALAAGGVVSLGSVVQAEEAQHQVLTALSQTTLSGYVDTSAIWKFGTGNGGANPTTGHPGRAFDGSSKFDRFNLNVVKLTLEKALDEAQWSAGYKVDLLVGPDAVLFNPSLGGGGEVSLKDAYVNLRAPVGNGIDLKIGSFTTVVGYEVFESPNNPNYSRSYGWQLEPTQHTGVLASYQLTDLIGVAAGVANTWSSGLSSSPVRSNFPRFGNTAASETEKTYMAALTLEAPESLGFLAGSVLYGGIVDGLAGGGSAGANRRDTTSYYVGATVPTPLEGLGIGAAYDYRDDGPSIGGNNSAYAVAGYVSYQLTERLKLNGRVDYTSGDDGTWFSSVAAGRRAGEDNELISYTATLDYSLWENVLTRAEVRWDHALNDAKPFGKPTNFDENAVTLAANIVYRF